MARHSVSPEERHDWQGNVLFFYGAEVWTLMQDPNTHVYVAGLRKSFENPGKTMARIAGSEKAWQRKKKELVFYEQWSELAYA